MPGARFQRTNVQKPHYFPRRDAILAFAPVPNILLGGSRRHSQTPFFATRPLRNAWFLNGRAFPHVGARFCKCDSRPGFFKVAPRVWCDDSYGAAHRRIRGRQTCLQNQLNFNSFVLRRVGRYKTSIFSPGISLLFDKAFFSCRRRLSFFHRNLHVPILTRFAN